MEKKTVLIVYSGARIWGGIETYLENLFRFYDKERLELILVSLGVWELTERLQTTNHQCLILNKARIRHKTISELVKVTKEKRVALFVSQGVVANFYARVAAKKAKIPHLTTIHSNLDYDYPDGAIRLIYRLSDRLLRKETSRFIVVSNYLRKELVKSGLPNDKVTVIYNGVDSEVVRLKTKSHLPRITNQTIIGSIGRFHYTKGYHNLITAFTYLKGLPLSLVIYGDGEERKSLEELINELGLAEKVYLPGFTRDIAQALDNLDIYIQSSLMEGFGLTVIEALLAGKPTIVTPVGSLPELISDGKTGLITGDSKPESIAVAIKTLVENTELAKKLAKAGQIDARKNYSIERWLAETEKAYLETIK